MRLSSIKLSGFKSFVDPTTLHLPTNLTGIVGPNGCGKSNIIDAIRWVMGESAASRLRGDAITDVIFSGSGSRKPVGTATVELIFDNSDGLVGGEYAGFAEISVKRTVSRDGQSSYFLNGGRCRRRDIIDVFLGTGLGARSYSIIEQGMISQIVEARPEELRTHLEEAAGISKYKERRKETESRIKSTRENLERLNDVRQEVEKNLDHLNRQARAAERWQKLKAESARVEAELKALSLKAQEMELDARGAALRESESEIERITAEQRAVEAQLETFRDRQIAASDRFNAVQAEVYRVGGEIARVEQQIQHNKDLAERLQHAARETESQLAELTGHLLGDRGQIEEMTLALEEATPRIEALEAEAESRSEALRLAEQSLADWQVRWDAYAKDSGEAARLSEVERTRLDYLDRQALEIARRLEQLEAERAQADVAKIGEAAGLLDAEQDTQRERVETLTTSLDERKRHLEQLTEQRNAAQAELSRCRQAMESAKGRLASLEALQHAALGQEKGEAKEWLERIGLGGRRRLGEALEVADGWERAVETVLGGVLDGVLVDGPHDFADRFGELGQANVSLFADAAGGSGAVGTLAANVRGPAAVLALLSKVRTAESLGQARGLARRLAPGESVITPSGEWLGADWARISRGSAAQQGVIAREREIHAATAERDAQEARSQALLERLDQLKSESGDAEISRDDAQRELYAAHRRLSEIAGQLQSHQGRLEAARQRSARIEQETGELRTRLAEVEEQTRESRRQLDASVGRMGDLEADRTRLDAERRSLLERREEARIDAREAREQAHAVSLQVESRRAALRALEQSVARMDTQQRALSSRAQEIADQLATGGEPMDRLDAERRTYLDQRLLVDKELVEARKALDELDAETRQYDTERHRIERALAEARERLSAQRLEEQGTRLRAGQLAEAIAAAGFDAQAVIAELPPEADAESWQSRHVDLEAKIKRLEPVNLAAISEHAEQSERKNYLDAQLNDLNTALETLENAIRKIDRETRTRFKETFDKVNQGLQELFPRLFGGGHAYLELTGEDLLDTGVAIMARPPGKRVTNISLLSGGEKALTAVALVFAIFRLNPAPFCLLDEVDAPLDEANVGRFCQMVAEMSERVQFICVTHNKVTMEAARQLCGVTMREAGVSRLVQVDLAEAAKLAGAA
ncbi:MAG: chromosome segregation protein SMC [Xanthomonadaceae bacterium]|nr:chromosome segregation protein SMC [Xanthomonadaceae bacterium]